MASGLVDIAITKHTSTHKKSRQKKKEFYALGHNEGDFRICGRFVHLAGMTRPRTKAVAICWQIICTFPQWITVFGQDSPDS